MLIMYLCCEECAGVHVCVYMCGCCIRKDAGKVFNLSHNVQCSMHSVFYFFTINTDSQESISKHGKWFSTEHRDLVPLVTKPVH